MPSRPQSARGGEFAIREKDAAPLHVYIRGSIVVQDPLDFGKVFLDVQADSVGSITFSWLSAHDRQA